MDTKTFVSYCFQAGRDPKENGQIYVMPIDDDKKRFTDIYNQESDSLFRFCLLRVSDREKALELTQETFTRLWNSMVLGQKVDNPRALAYTVARNLIIDWYRRVKSVSLESLSGEDWDGDREFDTPDEKATLEIELNADSRRVLSMLEKLEPQYREVIHLRYVEDLSPKDIAEVLKLNANTVSVRITRGLEALRRLIGISKHRHD